VPGRVFFTIDFRHPSQETLDRLGDQVEAICRAEAGPCEVAVTEVSRETPIEFPPPVIDAIRRSVERRGYRHQPIYSAAGHDARHVAHLCPTAMIFIPCWRGLSHNEAESAEPADVAAGAQVVTDVLLDLAGRA
jgi:beta-ureidopropionase / N-carbamoyl-L-amino-acid hydrolase